MSQALGTEKIEALVDGLAELAKAGKKIAEDKKVSLDDLPHVIALLPKIPELVDAIKDIGDAIDEGKDLKIEEVIALIQKVNAKVKEIENH